MNENLMYRQKNGFDLLSKEERRSMEDYCSRYMFFMDRAKTEREAVTETIRIAEEQGFKAFYPGMPVQPGDRIYANNRNKLICFAVIGSEPLDKGCHITAAHSDSPRLDLKPNPLCEDSEFAYLKTHYYGGIKKYQWVTLPLAIHGVVVRKDGTKVDVVLGEADEDPVFCITDLLPHLAQDQMTKTAAKVIEGEALNLLIGSRPQEDTEKNAVQARMLALLAERFGIEEEDFLSAELEIVPAGRARDMGLDRSMILGYGHDDRCCAYPSLRALIDYEGIPQYTLCCVLTDKEEIGSVGASGMGSRYFENVTAEVLSAAGQYSDLALRRTLANSRMLSSDVSAAYDPEFAEAFEKKNAAYLGRGVCFNKYTGSRGKSGSSDANAEFMAEVRRIYDDAGVAFQTAELGRVDLGGGGTIAYLCAKYGMNVIDAGLAVLSMHAPWEIISKVDLYEGYRGYCAFLEGARPIE